VQELFPVNSVGVVTARDSLTIQHTKEELIKTIKDFVRLDTETARDKFNLGHDARDWSVAGAKKDLTPHPDFSKIVEINYRPFDKRYTYYTGVTKGFHCMPRDKVMRHFLMERPRAKVMQHFLKGENVGLIFKRGFTENTSPAFVSSHIVDFRHWSRPGMQGGDYIAPLYLYSDQATFHNVDRTPNLDAKIVEKIAQSVKLEFEPEKSGNVKKFAPIDILDYIYAVLHSPTYREKYKEFLKIDFPRVPYPDDAKTFWKLVKLGEKLRRLHLMEGVVPQQRFADYNVTGSNVVEKYEHTNGKVWINDTQFFDSIPAEVWNFYIGGYQPAQKWLKDRKGRSLNFDEIQHYRKIVFVLKETLDVMNEVDKILLDE
jgi:predicted helicase